MPSLYCRTIIVCLSALLIIGPACAPRVPRVSTQDPTQGLVEEANALSGSGDEAAISKFGWKLLREQAPKFMAGESSIPDWEAWASKCDFSPVLSYACPSEAKLLHPSVQSPSGARRFLTTIYYNPAAAEWIAGSDGKPNLADLNTLEKAIKDGEASIPSAGLHSVVIKEIWAGFNVDETHDSKAWKLPIYDATVVADKDGQLRPVKDWPTFTIKHNGRNPIDGPCDGSVIKAGTQVPLTCFVSKVSEKARCDDFIKLLNTMETVGQPLGGPAPCIVALVGVHVATKMLKNWTWTTFWFTGNPVDPIPEIPYLPMPLRYFSSATQLPTNDFPIGKGSAPTVSNPYLEGPNPHGTKSSCVSCHAQAAYARGCNTAMSGCFGNNAAFAQPASNSGNQQLPCWVDDGGKTHGDCVRTSFLWSLAVAHDKESATTIKFDLRHSIVDFNKIQPMPDSPKK